MEPSSDILTPKEVAQYLKVWVSWVYKNQDILGGRKLRGSLRFPGKEDLYEHLFRKTQRMEVRFPLQQKEVSKQLLQNQDRGKRSRGRKTKGTEKPGPETREPTDMAFLTLMNNGSTTCKHTIQSPTTRKPNTWPNDGQRNGKTECAARSVLMTSSALSSSAARYQTMPPTKRSVTCEPVQFRHQEKLDKC